MRDPLQMKFNYKGTKKKPYYLLVFTYIRSD